LLRKIRHQIQERPAPAVDFGLGPEGARTRFAVERLTALVFNRQATTAPGFVQSPVPLSLLGVVPGAVGQLAFGRYLSPDYETAEKFIPPVATLLGVPAVQAVVPVYVNLFLPAGTLPPGGWPVALFGHACPTTRTAPHSADRSPSLPPSRPTASPPLPSTRSDTVAGRSGLCPRLPMATQR
jgi:hypothetical protein